MIFIISHIYSLVPSLKCLSTNDYLVVLFSVFLESIPNHDEGIKLAPLCLKWRFIVFIMFSVAKQFSNTLYHTRCLFFNSKCRLKEVMYFVCFCGTSFYHRTPQNTTEHHRLPQNTTEYLLYTTERHEYKKNMTNKHKLTKRIWIQNFL